MKQEVRVLIPTELLYWVICEKERQQTTLSKIFVNALQAYKDSKKEVIEDE